MYKETQKSESRRQNTELRTLDSRPDNLLNRRNLRLRLRDSLAPLGSCRNETFLPNLASLAVVIVWVLTVCRSGRISASSA